MFLNLCDIKMQNFHSVVEKLISYLKHTRLFYCRKLGALLDDIYKIRQVGLGTRNHVILLSNGYDGAEVPICRRTARNMH